MISIFETRLKDIKYPNKQDYINIYIYDKGKVLYTGTKSTLTSEAIILMKTFPYEEWFDEISYKTEVHRVQEERLQLDKDFGIYLETTYNTSNHPKKDTLLDKAMTYAKHYTFREIEESYISLMELI